MPSQPSPTPPLPVLTRPGPSVQGPDIVWACATVAHLCEGLGAVPLNDGQPAGEQVVAHVAHKALDVVWLLRTRQVVEEQPAYPPVLLPYGGDSCIGARRGRCRRKELSPATAHAGCALAGRTHCKGCRSTGHTRPWSRHTAGRRSGRCAHTGRATTALHVIAAVPAHGRAGHPTNLSHSPIPSSHSPPSQSQCRPATTLTAASPAAAAGLRAGASAPQRLEPRVEGARVLLVQVCGREVHAAPVPRLALHLRRVQQKGRPDQHLVLGTRLGTREFGFAKGQARSPRCSRAHIVLAIAANEGTGVRRSARKSTWKRRTSPRSVGMSGCAEWKTRLMAAAA
jgi:hypothetical protein